LAPTGRFAASQIIPEPVWLEALVNAVIHRSYSMGGDHIRIELFEDRAEVESPGRLPGLVRLDNIRSTRFARNPRIARALADLGYGRELGEGVDRMFEEMNRAGLPDPVFEQRPASVKVALLADRELNELLEGLPAPAVRLAEHASRLGSLRTVDAVSLLRVSRPTALRHLHSLADRGILEHTGSSLSDPRGTWQFVDPNRRPLNT
jgi:ATP-dependent DNA helicase RecG